MEAFTRLQQQDLLVVDTSHANDDRASSHKLQKNNSKQQAVPLKSRRNSLPHNTNNSLVPVPTHARIYQNLDTFSNKPRHFSLPRIRELWFTDTDCSHNTCANQNYHQRSVMDHHQNGGFQPENYPSHTHSHTHRQDGSVDFYNESEIATVRTGARLKARPDFSPAASNSTESTGISSRSRRSDIDTTHKPFENSTAGQFLPNTDFQHSFKSTNSRSVRSNNALALVAQPGIYPPANANPCCPSCNGVIPLSHLETIPELSSYKAENGLWNFNNFHYPLHRDSSIGGFTLTGQPRAVKKSKMSRFCSSHKIALVVSTFSLLVTIGLIITLLLMKKKGMMEPM